MARKGLPIVQMVLGGVPLVPKRFPGITDRALGILRDFSESFFTFHGSLDCF